MSSRRGRRRLTAGILVGVAGGMLGLSFASVPLYRMFCEATGYDGTPRTVNVVRPERTSGETITVHFDANVNSALPWRFQPDQREVHVRLGEETLVSYTARNLSDKPITGVATFNVVPEKVAQYFNKLQCFCFSEQTLAPGEEVSMPIIFFVDPRLAEDVNARDATNITLSYTFYRAEGEASQSKANTLAESRRAGG